MADEIAQLRATRAKAEALVQSQRDVYENEREEYAEHVTEMGEKLRQMSNARIDAEAKLEKAAEALEEIGAGALGGEYWQDAVHRIRRIARAALAAIRGEGS